MSGRIIGGMFVPFLIALFALLAAAAIVYSAVRRHHGDAGATPSWGDVKDAFRADVMRDLREDVAHLSEPGPLDSDLTVADLLEASEAGSGYIEPRDLLDLRGSRD